MLTPATKESYACCVNYYNQIAKTLSHAGLDVIMLAALSAPLGSRAEVSGLSDCALRWAKINLSV